VPYFITFLPEKTMPSCSALVENYTFLPNEQSIQSRLPLFYKSARSSINTRQHAVILQKASAATCCSNHREREDGKEVLSGVTLLLSRKT